LPTPTVKEISAVTRLPGVLAAADALPAGPIVTAIAEMKSGSVQAISGGRQPADRAALPGILTGMRICMAGAWTSIVAAELIAATTGLGYLIMQASDYLNTALVFSGIIAIAILGLTLDACLRGLLLLADPSRRR
jgi:Binding-protein-dependent transport system inner membrane component